MYRLCVYILGHDMLVGVPIIIRVTHARYSIVVPRLEHKVSNDFLLEFPGGVPGWRIPWVVFRGGIPWRWNRIHDLMTRSFHQIPTWELEVFDDSGFYSVDDRELSSTSEVEEASSRWTFLVLTVLLMW